MGFASSQGAGGRDHPQGRYQPTTIAPSLEIEADSYGECADRPEVTRARLESALWIGVLEEAGQVVAYAIGALEGNLGRTLSAAVTPEASAGVVGLGAIIVQAGAYQLAAAGARQLTVLARPDIRGLSRRRVLSDSAQAAAAANFDAHSNERSNAARRRQRHVDGMKVRFGEWR